MVVWCLLKAKSAVTEISEVHSRISSITHQYLVWIVELSRD